MVKPYYKTSNCALYQCDNLELMKQLPDNYIDLIYCDILYNTGKKFKNYNDSLGKIQEAISWYEPRLKEMFRLLKNTGSIYLQMDFRLSHYMKVKMDEVFGYDNFVNEIIWSYRTGGTSKNYFSRKHDVLLFYSKTNKFKFEHLYEKTYIPSLANRTFAKEELGAQIDNEGCPNCGLKGQWYKMSLMRDVWEIQPLFRNSRERTGYSTQKPMKLSERVILSSSNKDDIVADFFMGSGTTGEVALKNERKFIGCDIEEKACKLTQERIEKCT